MDDKLFTDAEVEQEFSMLKLSANDDEAKQRKAKETELLKVFKSKPSKRHLCPCGSPISPM